MAHVNLLIILLLCHFSAGSEVLTVAVASNFQQPSREVGQAWSAGSGIDVVWSSASTGKHYAQILNGAPFDLFLAADRHRPKLLEQHGFNHAPRVTYAWGRLVLWAPQAGLVVKDQLQNDEFRYLALANPRTAPYGLAARQTLEALGFWKAVQGKLVTGESVSQALQFALSGNAQLALVARSQITLLEQPGSSWLIPETLHQPIEQQAILIKDSPAARSLLQFLRSAESRTIIARHGYDLGPAEVVE